VTGQFGAQVVVAGLPGRGLARGQLLQAGHQFGRGELGRRLPC